MKRKSIKFLCVALLVSISGAAFIGCGKSDGNAGEKSSTISISGSTSVGPLMGKLAEKYEEDNSNVSIEINEVGSSAGIKDTINGVSEIGMSSRELKSEEASEVEATTIAYDGIAIITNKNNQIKNITIDEIKGIYTGKITNWKEVGGEDLRIQLINRDEASGTREAFRTIVMDGTPFDRRSAVLSGTGQVRDVVSRSRGAIGYISLGFVDSLNAKTSVKAVSVNHVEASEKTVASGGYPISRDLYFFVKGAPSQQAQDYIDYVTSEKMDKQIREAGFIPVTNDEKGSE